MARTLRSLLEEHVRRGTMPGAIASLGRELDPVAVGAADLRGTPLPPDAIVRIQSMTKLVTAVAALRMVQDGRLGLDSPVATWLPELSAPRVLVSPEGPLEDTVPAERPITLRDLLTNQSGYGMIATDSPLQQAMRDARVEPTNDPIDRDSQAWVEDLARLPLAHQPGQGWRYHLSFMLLGILLGRAAGTSTGELLRGEVLDAAGMVDTGFRVDDARRSRLVPALRRTADGFEETEPAAGGFHVGPAPFDVSHGELVSTLADYHRFLTALLDGALLDAPLLAALRTDQIAPAAKTEDSFFPGFWDGLGWGFGVSVVTEGPHRGRWGWSGGQGTDFFVDPDGTIGIVLTQVEMDEQVMGLFADVQALETPGS